MSSSEEEDNVIIITFEDLPIASIFGTQLYSKIKDMFNFYLPKSFWELMEEYNANHSNKAVIMEVCTTNGIEHWLLIQERIIPEEVKEYATIHGLKIANGVKKETIENISNNTVNEETDIWYLCYTVNYSTDIPDYWVLLQPTHILLENDIKTIEENECCKPYSTYESGTVTIHFISTPLKFKDYQYAEFLIKKFDEKNTSTRVNQNVIIFNEENTFENAEILTLN